MNKNDLTNEKFFDYVSEFYDGMINFSKSLENRLNVLKNFLSHKMHTAVDLGCGTGLDSIALSKLGLKVTGFDNSAEMINKARRNSELYKCNVKFYKSGLHQISAKFKNNFDIGFSLGNTVANLNKVKLLSASGRINKILKPHSLLVIQILNFNLIKKNKNRILKISQDSDYFLIRFFDILKNNFNLNVLSFNSMMLNNHKLLTTKLYPYTADYLKSVLLKTGFRDIKFFGDLNLKKYDKNISNDIIILANKI